MKKEEMVEKLLSKSYKIYTWDRKDDCDCPYMEVYRDGRWQFDLILVEVDQEFGEGWTHSAAQPDKVRKQVMEMQKGRHRIVMPGEAGWYEVYRFDGSELVMTKER